MLLMVACRHKFLHYMSNSFYSILWYILDYICITFSQQCGLNDQLLWMPASICSEHAHVFIEKVVKKLIFLRIHNRAQWTCQTHFFITNDIKIPPGNAHYRLQKVQKLRSTEIGIVLSICLLFRSEYLNGPINSIVPNGGWIKL